VATAGISMPGPDRLPAGSHRDLVEALHLLYRGAGMPGLRRIAKAVMEGDFRDTVSHEKVGEILRGDGLPSWTKLEPVVRVLVNWSTARLDVDIEIIRIQQLWQRARSHQHGMAPAPDSRPAPSLEPDPESLNVAAADGYELLPEVADRAISWLEARRATRPSSFGNALAVRELFAAMETRMARRAAASTADFPAVFIADDVPSVDGDRFRVQ
jgi:hypothetical protein